MLYQTNCVPTFLYVIIAVIKEINRCMLSSYGTSILSNIYYLNGIYGRFNLTQLVYFAYFVEMTLLHFTFYTPHFLTKKWPQIDILSTTSTILFLLNSSFNSFIYFITNLFFKASIFPGLKKSKLKSIMHSYSWACREVIRPMTPMGFSLPISHYV